MKADGKGGMRKAPALVQARYRGQDGGQAGTRNSKGIVENLSLAIWRPTLVSSPQMTIYQTEVNSVDEGFPSDDAAENAELAGPPAQGE